MIANQCDIFFSTLQGRMAVTYRPGNPVFLFVHGLGGCRRHFEGAFSSLCGNDFGIISVDLLGFGDSEHFRVLPEKILPIQIRALSELLSAYRVSEITLVLHSLSTALLPAIIKEKSWPKIKRIVFIEGDILKCQLTWSKQLVQMEDRKFIDYIKKFGLNAVQALRLQLRTFHDKKLIESWAACFTTLDIYALKHMAKECFELVDLGIVLDTVNRLDIPCEYLYGEGNHVAKSLPEAIHCSGFHLSPILSSGHYPMLDNPDETYLLIFQNNNNG
ncbi:MAG: alpha/beta hydrolase [Bacteroidales bacterium]